MSRKFIPAITEYHRSVSTVSRKAITPDLSARSTQQPECIEHPQETQRLSKRIFLSVQELQVFRVRILENDKATEIARMKRKGRFTPNTLQATLEKENARWSGVLYEEEDLFTGLGGEFQLQSGTYILVLGSNSGKIVLDPKPLYQHLPSASPPFYVNIGNIPGRLRHCLDIGMTAETSLRRSGTRSVQGPCAIVTVASCP